MLAVTNHIAENVGSMPFLWIVPLALYLMTFILAFAHRLRVSSARVSRLIPLILLAIFPLVAAGVVGPARFELDGDRSPPVAFLLRRLALSHEACREPARSSAFNRVLPLGRPWGCFGWRVHGKPFAASLQYRPRISTGCRIFAFLQSRAQRERGSAKPRFFTQFHISHCLRGSDCFVMAHLSSHPSGFGHERGSACAHHAVLRRVQTKESCTAIRLVVRHPYHGVRFYVARLHRRRKPCLCC